MDAATVGGPNLPDVGKCEAAVMSPVLGRFGYLRNKCVPIFLGPATLAAVFLKVAGYAGT